MKPRWAALDAARNAREPRLPFFVGSHSVGSVARRHLDALASWPHWFVRGDDALRLVAPDATAALAEVNAALRAAGRIAAWRDETYAVRAHAQAPPLASIERAASRFWGTLTFGAHCNGFVAGANGRPAKMWIARRAATKATDPGKLDNLVGGGVPHGQTPFEALVREGFEEAGLDAATMRRAQPGSVIAVACDIAEGFMHEHLHAFDLAMPDGVVPRNQDGEVDAIDCLDIAEALECAAAGEMTVDAALVVLDFALRHRLLGGAEHETLSLRLARLVVVPAPRAG